MTDKPTPKQRISVSTDDDLSPEDIQAKIDAQAGSIGKKPEPKAEAKPTESEAISIKVTTSKTAQITAEKPKVSAAKPTQPAKDKVTEPAVVSHRGKILNPADARKDEAVDGTDKTNDDADAEAEAEEPSPEVAETPDDKRPEIKPDEPKPDLEPETVAPATEVSEKIGEISDDIKEQEAQKEAVKEEIKSETQQPQIFDTKQYHLPIKATKHHKKGSSATSTLIFLLLLVVAVAYIAADMDKYDPGFELPFDFL